MPIVSPRYLITTDILLCAGGFFLLTRLTPASSYAPLILAALVVVGLGSGLIAPPSLHTALVGVAASDTGAAAAMSSTSNQIGASIGTALLNGISVSAAAVYVSSHRQVVAPAVAAIHGYTVALAFGGGIELVGALLVFLLITGSPGAQTA
jgi:hypothetical protein